MNEINTLFYPFEKQQIPWPGASAKTLFLNARAHPALTHFKNLTCWQTFYPYAQTLESVSTDISGKQFDLILVALPKNRIESEYLIAHALECLAPDGRLIAAADNKAGGTRIAKTFKEFGLSGIIAESKNKARVVWATNTEADAEKIAQAIEKGEPQIKNGFHTQPGIYGWNKIDKGSEILTQYIPEDLKGHGADFGCSYGYLAQNALQNCPKIKSLNCIDADSRALECCKENLKDFPQATYTWDDLTKPSTLKNLDFIIMNPPFHEGKNADTAIGKAFIENAYAALKKHGTLYMVANTHLPYEDTLKQTFFTLEKLHEGGGFKVYKATK